MTTPEWNAWIKFGGGQGFGTKIRQFGLKALACGSTGTQAGGWFNKEIESADDLKGLKMRIPGLGGQVMSKLGVLNCFASRRPDLRKPRIRRD